MKRDSWKVIEETRRIQLTKLIISITDKERREKKEENRKEEMEEEEEEEEGKEGYKICIPNFSPQH